VERAAEDLGAAWHTVTLFVYIHRLENSTCPVILVERPDTVWTRISVKVRDVVRLIESEGWKHVRTTGSHRHFPYRNVEINTQGAGLKGKK